MIAVLLLPMRSMHRQVSENWQTAGSSGGTRGSRDQRAVLVGAEQYGAGFDVVGQVGEALGCNRGHDVPRDGPVGRVRRLRHFPGRRAPISRRHH